MICSIPDRRESVIFLIWDRVFRPSGAKKLRNFAPPCRVWYGYSSKNMKTVLTILYGACLAATLTFSQAADSSATSSADASKKSERRQKPKLTEEQKQLRKDILAKYDTNKDGRLDRDERAKVSDEDKDKLKKAGLSGGGPRKPAGNGEKAGAKSGTDHSSDAKAGSDSKADGSK